MRVTDTRDVVAQTITALAAIRAEALNPENMQRLTGIVAARDALLALRASVVGRSAHIHTHVESMLKSPIFHSAVDSLSVPTAQWQQIDGSRTALVSVLRPLADALSAAAPEARDGGVLVKLPAAETLDDVAKVLQSLSKVFDLPLGHVNDPPARFAGVDSGSTWLVLVAQTAAAFNVIAALFAAIAKLLEAAAQFRLQSQYIAGLKLDAEVRKAQEELNRQAQAKLIDALAAELSGNPTGAAPREPDPERLNVYVQSLRTFADLALRGAELRLLPMKSTPSAAEPPKAVGSTPELLALPPGGAAPTT